MLFTSAPQLSNFVPYFYSANMFWLYTHRTRLLQKYEKHWKFWRRKLKLKWSVTVLRLTFWYIFISVGICVCLYFAPHNQTCTLYTLYSWKSSWSDQSGGINFTSGCVSNSCFLWTISLHCVLSLCQSYDRVTMIMKLVHEVYFVVHEEGRGKLKLHLLTLWPWTKFNPSEPLFLGL